MPWSLPCSILHACRRVLVSGSRKSPRGRINHVASRERRRRGRRRTQFSSKAGRTLLRRTLLGGCLIRCRCARIGSIRSLSTNVESRRDRLGLRATTRAAATPLLAFIRGLGATIGAVRRLSFLVAVGLLALGRLAARLRYRVRD